MKVVIFGAGGHGVVVADVLFRMREAGARVEAVAFIDESADSACTMSSLPVLSGGVSALTMVQHDAVIVAIGDNATRRRIADQLRRDGKRLATAIHPASIVARAADVNEGTVICAGAIVGPAASIGTGAILNTHCSVDHHGVIGDFVHIGPGAHLGGAVSVGDDTLIGIGASVVPLCRIGSRVIVGAGAAVVRDLPDDVVAIGVPAQVRTTTGHPRRHVRDAPPQRDCGVPAERVRGNPALFLLTEDHNG